MNRRQRLRQKIMFKMDRWPDWMWPIVPAVERVACWVLGHYPIGECHDPGHDHCSWCLIPMPGKAVRNEVR